MPLHCRRRVIIKSKSMGSAFTKKSVWYAQQNKAGMCFVFAAKTLVKSEIFCKMNHRLKQEKAKKDKNGQLQQKPGGL